MILEDPYRSQQQFQPEQMMVMTRNVAGVLTASNIALPENLKLKTFRDGFRTRFCEALLARRVIVVEGKTELVAYSAVARRAAELEPAHFQRLDALGWVPFDAGGQTAVASFAAFFRSLYRLAERTVGKPPRSGPSRTAPNGRRSAAVCDPR